MPIPTFDEMFNPLLTALHKLGGSGSVSEIDSAVAEILNLNDEEINEIHRGNRTIILSRIDFIHNSKNPGSMQYTPCVS